MAVNPTPTDSNLSCVLARFMTSASLLWPSYDRSFSPAAGYKTKYDDVDVVTIRENTEGEYTGIEHEVRRSCFVGLLSNIIGC